MPYALGTTRGGLALLVLLCCTVTVAGTRPLYGQARVRHLVSGTVGITHLQGDGVGGSVGAGYVIAGRRVALSLIPLDLALFPKDDDVETVPEPVFGGSPCQNRRTGAAVSSDLCEPRVVFAASADVLATLPLGSRAALGAGGGMRIGNSAGPYALAAIVFGPLDGRNWHLRGRFGETPYVDVAVDGSLPLHCVTTTAWRHCR